MLFKKHDSQHKQDPSLSFFAKLLFNFFQYFDALIFVLTSDSELYCLRRDGYIDMSHINGGKVAQLVRCRNSNQ